MEQQQLLLILLPVLAFAAAWGLATWHAQRNNQQLHTELGLARASLDRLQTECAEQSTVLANLTQQKSALDVAVGRLETERDSGVQHLSRLEQEISSLKLDLKTAQQSEQVARESNSRAQESASKLQGTLATEAHNFNERLSDRDLQNTKLEAQLAEVVAQHKQGASQLADTRESLKHVQTQAQEQLKELNHYKGWWETASSDLKQTAGQLADAREAFQHAQTRLDEKNIEAQNYKDLWATSTTDLKALSLRYTDLSNSHTRLNTSLTEKQQSFDLQFKQLQDNRIELSKEFERLANEVLERKGKAFKEMNQESITTLLNPLQVEMNGFRARIEAIHTKDAEQRVELRTELKHLQSLNKEITDQADKLTTALRGQKKVQGNWGELMLENVLDSSGLRLNIDYKREVSFTTEDGRQRPDAIIYLPQKKHLVIDAKTSLVAYTDYVNAEDDLIRAQALTAHTRAVSDRINELADRNYFRLAEINSPEVVIMFIPIESAYVEALRHDEGLFQRAIERNVLVATPTTLLTSLRIVKQLWSFEERNKNTHELANRAQRFYDKLHGFVTSMQALGMQLDRAKDSYEKAFGQLYSGRGNLIKQAAEFKDLGVSVQKELPAELVERANLELVMQEDQVDEKAALTSA